MEHPNDEPVTREDLIADLYHKACPGIVGASSEEEGVALFTAGFDAGEQHGYALGFAKGGEVTAKGLIGVPDRARREREQLLTLGGNRPPAAPASKLENINADQLTAEICLVLTMYATLPLEVRVDAVFEALKSLGVVASRKH